jgi:hypothetical protein
MPVSYKTYLYPGIGKSGGKALAEVKDLMGEFNKALVAYLKQEKIHDPQGIRLPGMSKAASMITKAKKDAGSNPLTVRGGISNSGDLVISVNGILPPAKPGGKPTNYDVSTIVREDFSVLMQEMKTEANAVVNLQPGDRVIDRAAAKQSAKFNAPTQLEADMDVGAIRTGTVVLAAHGGKAAVSGTVIGTALGRKTPEQIVALLTDNPDKRKRLSKKFNGTVLLSGCYTASGSGAIPEGYDYSVFAGKVKKLLDSKGYKGFVVKGVPGPAQTKDSGEKSGRHAMTTGAASGGGKALQQQLDSLYEKIQAAARPHGNDMAAIARDAKVIALVKQYLRIKKEREDLINSDDAASNRAKNIDGLIGTFGLRVR